MNADPSFVRSLKEFDPDLNVRWDKEMKHFVVFRRARRLADLGIVDGNPWRYALDVDYPVLDVVDENGDAAPLGVHVMATLHWGDMQREGPRKFASRIIEWHKEQKEKGKRNRYDQLRCMYKDVGQYMRSVPMHKRDW